MMMLIYQALTLAVVCLLVREIFLRQQYTAAIVLVPFVLRILLIA